MSGMDRITGAFVIRGTLTNTSPVVMGTGRGETIDIEIARGYAGEQPYIPATSLMGALRHRIAGKILGKSKLRYFWGGHQDSDSQSHFILEDLIPEEGPSTKVSVRDGIRIDHSTGIVDKGAKFTWEVLEPGARFRFHAEAFLRKDFDADIFARQIGRIRYELSHAGAEREPFAIGSMTTRGFGRVKLEEGLRVWSFDFDKQDHPRQWLEYRNSGSLPDGLLTTIEPVPDIEPGLLSLSAEFGITSSLIIGSYSPDPQGPDKVNLSSNGRSIISGTSLKGALRARAARILGTFASAGHAERLLGNLMGWADNTGKAKKKPVKSRLTVGELEVTGAAAAVQNRVKIDRFTGGALESALFDSKPLWETREGSSIRVDLVLKEFEFWEAGLLLHLLKDLWTGDLPLGGEKNVGRGVLKGKSAVISAPGADGKTAVYRITAAADGTLSFNEGAREALEAYAAAFTKKMEEMEAGNE